MPSSTFKFFADFGEQFAKGLHDLDGHTFKIALTNAAPNTNSDTQLSEITQIASGGGYVDGAGGGFALDSPTVTQTGSQTVVDFADETITATGAAIAQFRYPVVYNDSATNDLLVGYLDYGSAVDLASGESLLISLPSGLFVINANL